jgi:hypothetical protein
MAKRIIAGILGALAIFGSLLPLVYAFEIFKDIGSPDAPFWPTILLVIFLCLLALVGVWIGVRFLLYALTDVSQPKNTLIRPVLLGIGLFFPGFLFSYLIFISTLSVIRIRSLADISIELIFAVSACVGVATTIISTVLLLRHRRKGIRIENA